MSKLPDKFKLLVEQIKQTETATSELEKQIFGFTRAEAGSYVLGLWKIPPRIIESILLQSSPSESEYNGVNALTAVHVATSLLKPSVMQEGGRLFDVSLDNVYLERIGKLDQLPHWQKLAQQVIQRYPLSS